VAALAAVVGGTAGPADAHIAAATINARGTILGGGTIVALSGVVQATAGEIGSVMVIIQQEKGGKAVTGLGYVNLEFTGAPQGWALTASSIVVGETFASGPASVLVIVDSYLQPPPPEPPVDHSDELRFSARVSLHK
jgi:hypothetical protein